MTGPPKKHGRYVQGITRTQPFTPIKKQQLGKYIRNHRNKYCNVLVFIMEVGKRYRYCFAYYCFERWFIYNINNPDRDWVNLLCILKIYLRHLGLRITDITFKIKYRLRSKKKKRKGKEQC